MFILDGSENSLSRAFKLLDNFAFMSGLKVNISKTNAVWIGGNKGRQRGVCPDTDVHWVRPQESFRALGIDFSTNLDNMIDNNYNRVLNSISNLIKLGNGLIATLQCWVELLL